jgi:hypothetical protein
MTDDETTVSWTTIEPHWRVVSADDLEIGEVFNTVGDRDVDIFDGLAITHRGGPAVVHNYLDRPRYVAADQVASIQPGVVHLTVAADDARALPEHNVPESAEIEPEGASLKDRIETDIEHWTGEDKTY